VPSSSCFLFSYSSSLLPNLRPWVLFPFSTSEISQLKPDCSTSTRYFQKLFFFDSQFLPPKPAKAAYTWEPFPQGSRSGSHKGLSIEESEGQIHPWCMEVLETGVCLRLRRLHRKLDGLFRGKEELIYISWLLVVFLVHKRILQSKGVGLD